jgi:hypothetical protein
MSLASETILGSLTRNGLLVTLDPDFCMSFSFREVAALNSMLRLD